MLLGFFEAGQWPCALITSQRLLSRRDRPLGNSILQSGASLGAIATPFVVIALTTSAPDSWRLPFRVIGAARRVLGRRLAGHGPASRPRSRLVRDCNATRFRRTSPRGSLASCRRARIDASNGAGSSFAGSWHWRSSWSSSTSAGNTFGRGCPRCSASSTATASYRFSIFPLLTTSRPMSAVWRSGS